MAEAACSLAVAAGDTNTNRNIMQVSTFKEANDGIGWHTVIFHEPTFLSAEFRTKYFT